MLPWLLNHIFFENFHFLSLALPLGVLPFLSLLSDIFNSSDSNRKFDIWTEAWRSSGRDERQWVKSSKSIPNLHQSTENTDEENYTGRNFITRLARIGTKKYWIKSKVQFQCLSISDIIQVTKVLLAIPILMWYTMLKAITYGHKLWDIYRLYNIALYRLYNNI